MTEKTVEKKITPRTEDYSQWYLDVIDAAELAEHSPVKGCMVIKPNGYAIWEKTQRVLDAEFKTSGVRNAYFPLFIPERLLTREAEHVEGFAPEVAVVTHAGGKKLEEPLVVRPTSETIMYEVFSGWIRSYRDLPLLINQWANVVRWEMRTRLFLRTTEFLWQEGHTVHATDEEADARARQMLEVYRRFSEDYMALPVIPGVKSESEKFAGAYKTYSLEAMMQDGKALQFATSHHLGQNFAKAFNVKFLDQNNEEQFGWQTSWGLSTRSIGALIMAHSDDKGLVLPPKMAEIQVVIVPIAGNEADKEIINKRAEVLATDLRLVGLTAHVDSRDMRPGEKFYEWEKKGIPVRLEIGKRDLESNTIVTVRRDTGEKANIPIDTVQMEITMLLDNIQKDLFDRALALQKERTKKVDTWDEFVAGIEAGNFVHAHWCGDAAVEKEVKELTGATIRNIPFDSVLEEGVCIKSGRPSRQRVIFAKAY